MLEKRLSMVFVCVLFISSNAHAFGIPGFGGDDDKKSGSTGKCIDRNAGGDISWTDKIAKIALEEVMDTAAKEILTVKSLKLPKKITNTCDADKRLQYAEKMGKHLEKQTKDALTDVYACYDSHTDAKKTKSEIQEASISETADDLEKVVKTTTDTGAKKCAAGAAGALKGLTGYAGTVVGWDKELIDFGKDNFPWALKNSSLLKNVLGSAKDISVGVGTIGGSIVQPIWAGLTPYDKKKAKKEQAKATKDMKNTDKNVKKDTGDLV